MTQQNDMKSKMAMMQAMARQKEQQLRKARDANSSYKQFGATELYCPKCKQSMPVREKMLLALPSGDMYDYLCAKCGTSLGTKTGA